MSENRILSELTKRGELSKYHRRFHSLTGPAQRIALSLIKNGEEPSKAIKVARKAVTV